MANTEFKFSNDVKHEYPQCKVVVYPWIEELANPKLADDKLAQTYRLDISSQVKSVTFSKNLGAPSGSFSITLTNSPGVGTEDWKDIIKRGYWCVIYMSNEGDLYINPDVGPNLAKNKIEEAKRIRCIGYIERVEVNGHTQDNRSIDIGFTLSGRDFGIIYEETNIWHNMFQFDKIMLDSIAQTKLNIVGNVRVHEAIKVVHDLFYFPQNIPGAKTNDDGSLLSIGLQWLLPKEMLLDVGFSLEGLTKGTYWGALAGVFDFKENGGDISKTGAGIAVEQPGDYLSGNAWEQLKRLSVPQFHELFCETRDNGLPRLIFRPIPWSIDNSKYPKNRQNITMYKDIADVVQVPAVDLYSFDVGEDDNSRYNSFLATVSTTLISVENNVSLLKGKDFPKNNTASIKRHGFRPMHTTVDSIVKNDELGNGSADQEQLVEFNEILYDYWNQAIFAESGTVSKSGSSDVKIGKVMKFNDDVPYMCTKRYYIEGYTDTFIVGEKREAQWRQDVQLTRGFEESDLKALKGFGSRDVAFSGAGEFTKGDGESK